MKVSPTVASADPTLTHDLHELAHYISLICPQLAKLATLVVNQTMTRLSSLRPTFGMIHGDFYGKQVLVQDSQIRFIDFDQAGIGDRYQDIANFIAKLYWRAMQLSDVAFTDAAERAAELADSFLAGVITGFPSLNVAACKAHLAAALIRCATHPFRRARNNWAAETELLLKLAHSKLNSHATL
jgi:aminoglycoside phosphotransferase (APT) family kinase protein